MRAPLASLSSRACATCAAGLLRAVVGAPNPLGLRAEAVCVLARARACAWFCVCLAVCMYVCGGSAWAVSVRLRPVPLAANGALDAVVLYGCEDVDE